MLPTTTQQTPALNLTVVVQRRHHPSNTTHSRGNWSSNVLRQTYAAATAVVDDPAGRSRTEDSATSERPRIHLTTSSVNNPNTRHVETQLHRAVYEQLT